MADIFAEQGLYLTRTGNDRQSGWMAVRERLRVREDGNGRPTAALRIFSTCPNLIRTLPLLRYDERRPSDCARQPHELTHAPDALRGFCVYWIGAEQGEKPPSPRPKLIDRLQKGRGRKPIR